MDPDACFEKLVDCYKVNHCEEEWEEIEETARDLLDWLEKGGYAPSITLNPQLNRLIAVSVCRSIIAWELA